MNETTTTTDELKAIEAFSERYHYDTAYMEMILRASPAAFNVFSGFLPMARFREHADRDIYFTAKLTAFRQVDCGPCLQLAVRLAREAGVEAELVRSILAPAKPLPPLLATVRDFTVATLAGAGECEELRLQLARELGEPSIIEIALAIASAQVFPTVKRALGYHQSCSITALEI